MHTKNSQKITESTNAINELATKIGLEKNNKFDTTRSFLVAGLAGVPLIGGSLTSLIDDFIPTQKSKRLDCVINKISIDIEKISDKIKTDVINTDNFAYIFEKTLKGVMDNYQQEKIDCYRAILLNSLTNDNNLSNEQQEIFLQLLDNLTVTHVIIIAILFNNNSGDLIEIIQKSYSSLDINNINYIMDDLRKKGLVHQKGQIGDNSLNTNSNQLSEMGKKFTNFIAFKSDKTR